ncbi:hypothetical protein QQZ08_003754 [Neonectria magnoliae]|uniref:NB-ARC domain-containing protein n=1 Tax=Neonectria magnoliae TaxID=2732573 RepID=A0ABR1I7Z5_9HYPO
MEMLDEEHESLPQQPADHNIYKLGSINSHNIVIGGLPQTGNCSAAMVITQMRMTFPNLRYGLLVGIGGGVPAKDGHFERTGATALPPPILLNAAHALAVQRARSSHNPVWENAQRTQKTPELFDISSFLALRRIICITGTTFISSQGNPAMNVHVLQSSESRDRLTRATSPLLLYTEEETQRDCNVQSKSAAFRLPINLSEIFEVTRFVAREEELGRIQDILKGAVGRRTAILHGLGGIGKTQLAIAYFKRHRMDYSTAIWLNARDETTLKQSFARITERIIRHDPSITYISSAVESRDAERIVEAVKRWLDEPANDRWLLICDIYDRLMLTRTNATRSGQPDLSEDHTDEAAKSHRDHADPKAFDLHQYLPETDHGAIIVTSRLSVKPGQSIQLGKLKDIRDSLEILASASRRDNIKQGESL